MIALELLVALGIIFGTTVIVLRVLKNHNELKMFREERAARLEAAKTAKDIADELLLDKEMAGEVQRRLNKRLSDDTDE